MINDNDDVKPQNYTAPEYMFKQWNIYLCIVVQEFHMNSCTHGIHYKFSEQIAYFDISSCLKWHVKSFSDSHMNFKHKLQLGAEIANWTIKAGLGMLLNFDIHSCFFIFQSSMNLNDAALFEDFAMYQTLPSPAAVESWIFSSNLY